jgi:hypothetical protein
MSKPILRAKLASLSFTEKVKVLERLRDREIAIAAAGLRQKGRQKDDDGDDRFCKCLGWEPCACGNQPPYHCMWCCGDLTPEQVEAAKKRGFYSGKEK